LLLLVMMMMVRGEMLEILGLLRTPARCLLRLLLLLQTLTQLSLLLPVQLLRVMKGLLLLRVDGDRRVRGRRRM
jgi:hypothetical protein